MMRILLSLLLVFASTAYAKQDLPIVEETYSPLQVNRLFDDQYTVDIKTLPDLVERENRVASCISGYIEKQSKSYSKIVQNNLYDLIYNLDRITSRVYGKKPQKDEMPYAEKLEALAKVQCEAYNAIGALK